MSSSLSIIYPCNKDEPVSSFAVFLSTLYSIGGLIYLLISAIILRVFVSRIGKHQLNEPIVLNILMCQCINFPIALPIRMVDAICHSISRVICMVAIYIIRMTDFITVFSMLFFTFERYLRLFKPVRYRLYMKKKTVYGGIIFIWCLGFFVLIVDISSNNNERNFLLARVDCSYQNIFEPIYGFVTVVLYQIFPLVLLFIFNFMFFYKLSKIKASLRNQRRFATANVLDFDDQPTTDNLSEQVKCKKMKPTKSQKQNEEYLDLNKTRNWKKYDNESLYMFLLVSVCYTILVGPVATIDALQFMFLITRYQPNYEVFNRIIQAAIILLSFYPLVISFLYLFMARELFDDLLIYLRIKKVSQDNNDEN